MPDSEIKTQYDYEMTDNARELYEQGGQILFDAALGRHPTVDAYDIFNVMLANPHLEPRTVALIAQQSKSMGFYPRVATYTSAKDVYGRVPPEGIKGLKGLTPVRDEDGEITGYKAYARFALEYSHNDTPWAAVGQFAGDMDMVKEHIRDHMTEEEVFPQRLAELADRLAESYLFGHDMSAAENKRNREKINGLFLDVMDGNITDIPHAFERIQEAFVETLDWARDIEEYTLQGLNGTERQEIFREGTLFGVPVLVAEHKPTEEPEVPRGMWRYQIETDYSEDGQGIGMTVLPEMQFPQSREGMVISVFTPTALPNMVGVESIGLNADLKIGNPIEMMDYSAKIQGLSLDELCFSRSKDLLAMNQDMILSNPEEHKRVAGLYTKTLDFQTGKTDIKLIAVAFPPKNIVFEEDGSFDKLFGEDFEIPENAVLIANMDGSLTAYDAEPDGRYMTARDENQSHMFAEEALHDFYEQEGKTRNELDGNSELDGCEILAVYTTENNKDKAYITCDPSRGDGVYIQYGNLEEKGLYSGPFADETEAGYELRKHFPKMNESKIELMKAKSVIEVKPPKGGEPDIEQEVG